MARWPDGYFLSFGFSKIPRAPDFWKTQNSITSQLAIWPFCQTGFKAPGGARTRFRKTPGVRLNAKGQNGQMARWPVIHFWFFQNPQRSQTFGKTQTRKLANWPSGHFAKRGLKHRARVHSMST